MALCLTRFTQLAGLYLPFKRCRLIRIKKTGLEPIQINRYLIQIKDASPRRIAVDRNNDGFVRFDRTLIQADGTYEYHGYTVIWEASHGQNPKLALTPKERAVLIKNGLVDKKGNII